MVLHEDILDYVPSQRLSLNLIGFDGYMMTVNHT